MTVRQAEILLAKDCLSREATVMHRVKTRLHQHQFDALVSLEYNTGAVGAVSTAVRLINAGKMDAAADAILLWDKGRINGRMQTLPGLVRRRKCERELFLTGKLNFFN